MITLFDYWRSSASYRLRIALNLLNLPYEAVPVDLLKGEHRAPENLARNPQGLVPSVIIDGATMSQSLAIIEYLDETKSAGFMPKDPVGRARVRSLSYAIAMEIHPVCNLSVVRYAMEQSKGAITMESWMLHFIAKGLNGFEALLNQPQTGDYCHGDKITMADICMLPQVYNARRWKIDLTPMPKIRAIADRLEALQPVAAAHPDKHEPAA